jgi:Tol biopolymer transport system component
LTWAPEARQDQRVLTAGTKLGPYEIVSSLGAGGMGEVYKARDARLDRTVAIKVLPPALAADAEFRDRFDREARAVSQLDHPHICALYDIGQDHDTSYLVMQYLDGETLDNRLKAGALPLDQALKTAIEIAGALDAAHRAGIIHRDLKPGNVILTRAGAKLLDFGLAKTLPAVTSGSVSMMQTTPAAGMTAQGTILGTFQYMSPEQIEGEAVDARSDIFAFGAVLYEMVTGRKAFAGKTQASLLGAILKDEPPPVSQVQAMTPPALDYLVRTCLAKDPDGRFQTAHDVWLQLRWIAEGGSTVGVPAPVVSRRRSRERLAWAAAGVLGLIAVAAGALAVVHLRERPVPVEPVQFTIAADENSAFITPADFSVSPDGRQIVFVARSDAGQARPTLWVRSLASGIARPLPGTDGGLLPFWSPDGRSVGFFAAASLKKVDTSGGQPVTLCAAAGIAAGGTWNRDNVIVFAATGLPGLHKIDAAGGTPARVTTPKEGSHLWPSFLPDQRHILYLEFNAGPRAGHIASLDGLENVTLGAADSAAVYGSGHLLFMRGTALMAQPFDADRRQKLGDPFLVADQVNVGGGGKPAVSVSTTGVLAYWRGAAQSLSRLTWVDRAGKTDRVVGDVGAFANLSLSPDERRVAVALTTGSPVNRDIWVLDLARDDTMSRLTFNPGPEGDPIWSPDGSHIVFNSSRTGMWNSGFQRSADGSGDDVPFVTMERLFDSPDWSHDGRFVVFAGAGKDDQNADLWVLPLSGDRKPTRFLQTPFQEDSPAFSPDDKWVAYNSNASGRFEVYIRSFPGPGGQFQVSRNGGWAPRWRRDGKEIFFLGLDGAMMSADVTLGKEVQASVPRVLFPTPLVRGSDRHTYAVTGDGKRFLLRVPDQRQVSTPITMVLNWPAAARK